MKHPKPTAPVISRILRAEGFGVVATRSRYGLLVTKSVRSVTVTAQFPSDKEAEKRATEVTEFLKEKGYRVRQHDESLVSVYQMDEE